MLACAHLKETRKNLELILENQALPEDKSKSSMQSQTLKIADSKKTRLSSSSLQGKLKEESIPLHAKTTYNKEKVACKLRIHRRVKTGINPVPQLKLSSSFKDRYKKS